jgi:thioester reductase-like protein
MPTLPHCLLTGATGLLGRYLLPELLVRQLPVAVLARRQRVAAAADRIETILARSERLLGRSLPRPVILEGGIDSEGLRVSAADREWLAAHCSRVLHSAASLKFVADAETGEPWKSNVGATAGLLAECERLGIREFHAVSTAYVAGRRTGVVREDELDVGQAFGNVYEETKCESERRLRAARQLESVTIYRPSIIVGDSRTGYSSTYHGFYTPLRVASEARGVMAQGRASGMRFLDLLGLRGDERKDLVPVEWVAAAIARLVDSPACHGRTYHLTATRPVTVATIHDVFDQVLSELPSAAPRRADSAGPAESTQLLELWAAVRRQMEMYRAYWRDDPSFDRTNTDQALPDLPCPVLDAATLKMLATAAIRDNFGFPAAPVVPARHDIRQQLEASVARGWPAIDGGRPVTATVAPESAAELLFAGAAWTVAFEITGHGGVSWWMSTLNGRLAASGRGLWGVDTSTVVFRMTAATFDRLRSGEITAASAIGNGRVSVFMADAIDIDRITGWLEFFTRPA